MIFDRSRPHLKSKTAHKKGHNVLSCAAAGGCLLPQGGHYICNHWTRQQCAQQTTRPLTIPCQPEQQHIVRPHAQLLWNNNNTLPSTYARESHTHNCPCDALSILDYIAANTSHNNTYARLSVGIHTRTLTADGCLYKRGRGLMGLRVEAATTATQQTYIRGLIATQHNKHTDDAKHGIPQTT